MIPSLARSYRLVVPDVPGIGESAPLPRMDAAVFSEWFRALLSETISPEKPILLAHSMVGSCCGFSPLEPRFRLRNEVPSAVCIRGFR